MRGAIDHRGNGDWLTIEQLPGGRCCELWAMLTAQNQAGDKACVSLRLPWVRHLPCLSPEPSCGRPTPQHGDREPSISPASLRIIPRLNRWAATAMEMPARIQMEMQKRRVLVQALLV